MRVLECNTSDGVNPTILIQFESLYLTTLSFGSAEARCLMVPCREPLPGLRLLLDAVTGFTFVARIPL